MKETRRMVTSVTFPLAFVVVLWLVKSISLLLDIEIYHWGIYPQDISGLKGIIFSPFIHGSISHLASNSIPLLVLGAALFYFYREVAPQVVIGSILITGLWVWVIARPSYHIGASGVIYSLAAFLFVSGILRRHPRLMALSLLVSFLYGGLVWGIFPVKDHVSWESHLMGLVAGVILAVFFRDYGPQRPKYSWEIEEEEAADEGIQGGEESEAESHGPGVEHMPGSSAGRTGGNGLVPDDSLRTGDGGDRQDDRYRIRYDYKPRRSRSR